MTDLNIKIEDIKTIKLSKNELLIFKLGGNIDIKKLTSFKKQVIKAVPKLKDNVLFLVGDIEMTKVVVQ